MALSPLTASDLVHGLSAARAGLDAMPAAPSTRHADASATRAILMSCRLSGALPRSREPLAHAARDALGVEAAMDQQLMRIAVLDEFRGKPEREHGHRKSVGGERLGDRGPGAAGGDV